MLNMIQAADQNKFLFCMIHDVDCDVLFRLINKKIILLYMSIQAFIKRFKYSKTIFSLLFNSLWNFQRNLTENVSFKKKDNFGLFIKKYFPCISRQSLYNMLY